MSFFILRGCSHATFSWQYFNSSILFTHCSWFYCLFLFYSTYVIPLFQYIPQPVFFNRRILSWKYFSASQELPVTSLSSATRRLCSRWKIVCSAPSPTNTLTRSSPGVTIATRCITYVVYITKDYLKGVSFSDRK